MGIEPTWDAAQRPTLDLKSRRATSALSTSARSQKPAKNLYCSQFRIRFSIAYFSDLWFKKIEFSSPSGSRPWA